jgi:hypothetical protein
MKSLPEMPENGADSPTATDYRIYYFDRRGSTPLTPQSESTLMAACEQALRVLNASPELDRAEVDFEGVRTLIFPELEDTAMLSAPA